MQVKTLRFGLIFLFVWGKKVISGTWEKTVSFQLLVPTSKGRKGLNRKCYWKCWCNWQSICFLPKESMYREWSVRNRTPEILKTGMWQWGWLELAVSNHRLRGALALADSTCWRSIPLSYTATQRFWVHFHKAGLRINCGTWTARMTGRGPREEKLVGIFWNDAITHCNAAHKM